MQSLVPGQTTQTRNYDYTVDATKCRLTQQIIEPSSTTLKVTTNLGFDSCGNVNSVQVIGSTPAGAAMPARTTSFGYGTRCQLPESVTNALSQSTAFQYRYDFGVPSRVTDPNQLATNFTYDDFGRRSTESRPDSTSTTWTYTGCSAPPCWGVSDLRFRVDERPRDTSGAQILQRSRFYDGYDRLRYDEYHRVLGKWTNEVFYYDSLGRLERQYRPYESATNGYTTWTYDPLSRPTQIKLYRPGDILDRTTTIAYAGRKTTTTDPLGRAHIRIEDVLGRLRRVTDPSPGGTTYYDYDAFGNLNRIQDPINAVSSGTYNLRGFRTQWADADRGTWSFKGNSLNELVEWTDAKSQTFSATYDPLGRITSRTEPGAGGTFTWGNSPAAKNIGQLESMSGGGYAEILTYDSVGRLSQRKITTDQDYFYNYIYNTIGALDTLTYPTSPVPSGETGTRFKVKYAYSSGAPYKITNETQAPTTITTLWELTAANDYSAPTTEKLSANLVTVTSGYKAWTNELTSLQSGVSGSTTNRQNLAYQWDTVGKLTQRQDVSQSLTEIFTHDTLDRVTGSTRNGASNLTVGYDAAGRITTKTGAGTYSYGDAAHPHAATAAGTQTRTYDANGNVATLNGQTQTWTSFNLPSILKSSASVQASFSYGPDHQRWKQAANESSGTEVTHYVGGLLEKVASAGVTKWRHYVPTPSGHLVLLSRNSNATGATTYIVTDHLGSSDTLLDQSGAIKAKLSFDAFGARRGSDWTTTTAPDWTNIAATTRRGFTFHTQLDAVSLVHMNGRVFDPKLGQFMSVDPIIGDMGDSQSVNPYAYVGNRSLSFVDPTGFQAACLPCLCEAIIGTALNFIFGGGAKPTPPPAISLPGQSAQNGTALCGPGATSLNCHGVIVYAGAPSVAGADVPSSSWVNEPTEADYARENLARFFQDLGINAVEVLILSTVRNAQGAYQAVQEKEYLLAAGLGASVVCDVTLKICKAAAAPIKGIARLAKSLGRSASAARAGGLADDLVVVRGGMSDVPPPGQVFSGAYGRTLEEAASGVPHGQIRATTVGQIRAGGGTVEVVPELTRSGVLNERHVDICLGNGPCPFGPLQPNPVPKSLRIQ